MKAIERQSRYGAQEVEADDGATRWHGSPLCAQIRKPAGLAGFFVSISILGDWEKLSAKKRQGSEQSHTRQICACVGTRPGLNGGTPGHAGS